MTEAGDSELPRAGWVGEGPVDPFPSRAIEGNQGHEWERLADHRSTRPRGQRSLTDPAGPRHHALDFRRAFLNHRASREPSRRASRRTPRVASWTVTIFAATRALSTTCRCCAEDSSGAEIFDRLEVEVIEDGSRLVRA